MEHEEVERGGRAPKCPSLKVHTLFGFGQTPRITQTKCSGYRKVALCRSVFGHVFQNEERACASLAWAELLVRVSGAQLSANDHLSVTRVGAPGNLTEEASMFDRVPWVGTPILWWRVGLAACRFPCRGFAAVYGPAEPRKRSKKGDKQSRSFMASVAAAQASERPQRPPANKTYSLSLAMRRNRLGVSTAGPPTRRAWSGHKIDQPGVEAPAVGVCRSTGRVRAGDGRTGPCRPGVCGLAIVACVALRRGGVSRTKTVHRTLAKAGFVW